MSKKIFLFALVLAVFFTGCDNSSKIVNVDTAEEIKEITISTLPALKDSPKTVNKKDNIDKIINYLNSLSLEKPKENADEYVGMSYIIQITYEDDSKKEYVHFGNKFFKEINGPWKEMDYKQAEQLSSIYENL